MQRISEQEYNKTKLKHFQACKSVKIGEVETRFLIDSY